MTTIDPELDLVFERTVDVPPEFVFRAWTEPELIKKWFTPAPWTTPHAEVDLKPGGIFRTIMRSPEGQTMDNTGCWLEVVPNRRWAAARPAMRRGPSTPNSAPSGRKGWPVIAANRSMPSAPPGGHWWMPASPLEIASA